jgi:hypothetical protein
MWESRPWQPRQGPAEETRTEDEGAKGWQYRQPLALEATVDAETLTRNRVPSQIEANVTPPSLLVLP